MGTYTLLHSSILLSSLDYEVPNRRKIDGYLRGRYCFSPVLDDSTRMSQDENSRWSWSLSSLTRSECIEIKSESGECREQIKRHKSKCVWKTNKTDEVFSLLERGDDILLFSSVLTNKNKMIENVFLLHRDWLRGRTSQDRPLVMVSDLFHWSWQNRSLTRFHREFDSVSSDRLQTKNSSFPSCRVVRLARETRCDH